MFAVVVIPKYACTVKTEHPLLDEKISLHRSIVCCCQLTEPESLVKIDLELLGKDLGDEQNEFFLVMIEDSEK